MHETHTQGALRVLHVNHSVEYGGAELALARVLRENRSWRAFLLLPRRQGRGRFEEPFDGDIGRSTTVLRSGPPSEPGATRRATTRQVAGYAMSIFRQAVVVTKAILTVDPDVVWANSSRSAVYASLALRRRRTSLILHLRDRVEKEALGTLGFLVMTRFALRRADGVVANSAGTLASASKYLRTSAKSIVLPSPAGILRASDEDVLERESSAEPSTLRIGMVARIDPWKGQDQVLRAFALSSEDTLPRPVSLHFAGAAEFGHAAFRQKLDDLAAELGIENQVFFEGRVDDVNAFVDRMDVCVQYSTRPEPLGQNVLQYLARGAAVIAANEGGPTEWIEDGENGLLVSPNSVPALADAFVALIEDGERRLRLRRNAIRTPGLRSDQEIAVEMAEYLSTVSEQRRGAR